MSTSELHSRRAWLVRAVPLAVVGILLGSTLRSESSDSYMATFAAYPAYATLAELAEGSDLASLGIVTGDIGPFVDYGRPSDDDTFNPGDGVNLRLFEVTLGSSNESARANEVVYVAVLDESVYGVSGDAALSIGDEVFAFGSITRADEYRLDGLRVRRGIDVAFHAALRV